MKECRHLALVVLLFIACKPATKQITQAVRGGGGPKVRATVVDIKTSLQPSGRTSTHSIVIGEDVARSTSDDQYWLLYDLKGNRVIHVDEFARTYQVEPLPALLQRRRDQLAGEV